MNRNVITKLIKAKQLEYEAVKEMMPQNIREHMELGEKQAGYWIREMGMEIYREFSFGSSEEAAQEEEPKKRKKSVKID